MLNEEKLKSAKEKLEKSFGNSVLKNLVVGEVKEVMELNGRLNFLFELRFKDNSAFLYYYAINMKDVKWED